MRALLYLGLIALIACPTAPENGPNQGVPQASGPQSPAGPANGPGPGAPASPGPDGPDGGNAGASNAQGSPSSVGMTVEDPNSGQGLVKNEGSVVNVVIRPQDPSQQAKFTQTALAEEKHVVFKGSIKSKGSDALMLRAKQFLEMNGIPGTEAILTEKSVKSGDFEMLIPKGKDVITLEVIVDSNNDGLASKGERFAVLERGDSLKNDKDRSGLTIDLTAGEPVTFTTMPISEGPNKTPAQNPPAQEAPQDAPAQGAPQDAPAQGAPQNAPAQGAPPLDGEKPINTDGDPADGAQAPSPQ